MDSCLHLRGHAPFYPHRHTNTQHHSPWRHTCPLDINQGATEVSASWDVCSIGLLVSHQSFPAEATTPLKSLQLQEIKLWPLADLLRASWPSRVQGARQNRFVTLQAPRWGSDRGHTEDREGGESTSSQYEVLRATNMMSLFLYLSRPARLTAML